MEHLLCKGYPVITVPFMCQVQAQQIVLNGITQVGLRLHQLPLTPQDYIVEQYIEIIAMQLVLTRMVFICGLEPHNNTK